MVNENVSGNTVNKCINYKVFQQYPITSYLKKKKKKSGEKHITEGL